MSQSEHPSASSAQHALRPDAPLSDAERAQQTAAEAVTAWYWIDPETGKQLPGGPDGDDHMVASLVLTALRADGFCLTRHPPLAESEHD